jgi:ferredoxin-NADP reductase
MMSMTKYLYDDARHTDITFVNCARRPSDLIFRAELERMATRVPDIKLTWIVEEPDAYACWTGYLGRLNQLMLELICPDYFEREIFCCGPEPFMQGVRDVLHVAGFDFGHYHEESFTAPLVAPAPVQVPDEGVPAEGARARVVFRRSGIEVVCRQTDTLLEIARASGLGLPSACQFGVCGTCKVKKHAGEVHMLHNGGISDDDVAAGYVLACCSKPLGRVEIDA